MPQKRTRKEKKEIGLQNQLRIMSAQVLATVAQNTMVHLLRSRLLFELLARVVSCKNTCRPVHNV